MPQPTPAPMIRRTPAVLASLVAGLCAASYARAAPATIDDVMMELVWEQTPSQYAGPASDSDCLHPLSGKRVWVFYADDVFLDRDALISRVTWQGLYDRDNPPDDEVMRLRISDARPSDQLPGSVVYEELTTNHTRDATGRTMAASVSAREFTYAMDLSKLVLLEAEERYWIEITQIGCVESAFRLVHAYPEELAPAFVSTFAADWTESESYLGTSFQLWAAVPEPGSAMLVCMAIGAGLVRRGRPQRRPFGLLHC